MKTRISLSILALAGMLSAVGAQEEVQDAIMKKGDRFRIQAVSPLMDEPAEVTIVSFGPKSWVLVEYEKSYLKAGESGVKKEKTQLWVNFDHVIAAKKIEAAK